ncbi:MAG: YraN family protein [Pseudomonadota bacterium]
MSGNEAALSRRRSSYMLGRRAELWAAIWLRLFGYSILGTRVRTQRGEIDLILKRGRRITFAEVKARTTLEAAQASVSQKQRIRVHRAAQLWLQSRPRYQDCDVTFDVVFMLPWRRPLHLVNAL